MLVNELYAQLKSLNETDENISVLKKLFSHVLGKEYILISQNEISKEDKEKITSFYDEYLKGKPLQYITHESWFLENKFYVDERVLIPRFATEDVVLKAVEYIDDNIHSLVDVGTGSGIIALSLKKMFPNVKVIATDISYDALDVCYINEQNLGVEVTKYQGNLLDPLIKQDIKVDMIISNPPYIEDDYKLDKRVKDYEPSLALFGGKTGMDLYKEILINAPKVLNKGGIIVFEIGFNQKELMSNLVRETYKDEIECQFFQDLEGNDRICVIKY